MTTFYRIVDRNHTSQIVANRIPSLAQAQEILELLRQDYPNDDFEIETYTQQE